MSLTSTFTPQGPTVLVGVTAVQIPNNITPSQFGSTTYRVRCLVTAYLTWGQASTVAAVGGPGTNTLGMTAGGVETFILPGQNYFIANVAAAFEMTPGEGM